LCLPLITELLTVGIVKTLSDTKFPAIRKRYPIRNETMRGGPFSSGALPAATADATALDSSHQHQVAHSLRSPRSRSAAVAAFSFQDGT
jgi:hypothetical protein